MDFFFLRLMRNIFGSYEEFLKQSILKSNNGQFKKMWSLQILGKMMSKRLCLGSIFSSNQSLKFCWCPYSEDYWIAEGIGQSNHATTQIISLTKSISWWNFFPLATKHSFLSVYGWSHFSAAITKKIDVQSEWVRVKGELAVHNAQQQLEKIERLDIVAVSVSCLIA